MGWVGGSGGSAGLRGERGSQCTEVSGVRLGIGTRFGDLSGAVVVKAWVGLGGSWATGGVRKSVGVDVVRAGPWVGEAGTVLVRAGGVCVVAWAFGGVGKWAWVDISSAGSCGGEAGTRFGTVQGPEVEMDCTIARV
ncbi:hypothetical protein FCV25MIE_00416 [Fagus crenata]